MELLTPSGGTIFWTIVTFSGLLFILYKIGWRPVLQRLTERETKIRDSLELAKKAQSEAEKTIQQQQMLIQEAKQEAQAIIAAGKSSAEKTREEIIQTARREADQMIEKANVEIEQSRNKAVDEIRNIAVEVSLAATAKMIESSLSKKDHQKLVQESINDLGKLI